MTRKHSENHFCADPVFMRKALLAWYDRHARDLPWRREQDPYRIWLSEVMLQQTRANTVIPYYTRFLEAYPTVEALSAAPEEKVLKLWEGLGYYARARNFLQAAREVQTRYGSRVPSDPRAFRDLPGVGDYIAAAVLSIAYQVPLAAVDGNIKRVLSRLYCLEENSLETSLKKEIQSRADTLLDPERPGDFNQALMDLGASTCTPRRPVCSPCPLVSFCLAYRRGKTLEIPPKKKQIPLPRVNITAVVIQRGDRCLVRQRPRAGLLGGLWEFPTFSPGVLEKEEVMLQDKIAELQHTFSHLLWHVTVYRGELHGTWSAVQPWRWATAEELASLPFPAVYHRLVEQVRKNLSATR